MAPPAGPDPAQPDSAAQTDRPGQPDRPVGSAFEVFMVALGLGLRSFGGPVAHLGYFRAEYVQRRAWLTDRAYAELIALTAFLPGPSSSQVGMSIGYLRAGMSGAIAGWAGFTLPSAVVLGAAGLFAATLELGDQLWLSALKLVAAAVILNAVLGMAALLARTVTTAAIAAAAAAAILFVPSGSALPAAILPVGVLACAGLAGLVLFRGQTGGSQTAPVTVPRRTGVACLTMFALLLALSITGWGSGVLAQLAGATYRAGALVFGGGHVVLPLLRTSTVPGLVPQPEFLAGYGLAQAVPGPLFTFGSYLGGAAGGVPGVLVATAGIFLPGYLILFGVLPFWERLRTSTRTMSALTGVNAAVVGLLFAALVNPAVSSSVHSWVDAAFAIVLFLLLRLAKVPAWGIVLIALAGSPLLGLRP